MKCDFENFKKLNLDTACIALESTENMYPYWCYPENCVPIGLEGGILYCFIEEYGDMVFASNPESCADENVYPIAKSFEDFIRLVITCGSANPLEQIVWMTKEKFREHLLCEKQNITDAQKQIIEILKTEFELTPIENPYEYVKQIQNSFDDSFIHYSYEYYDIKGIEKPQ